MMKPERQQNGTPPQLSVCAPLYNEEENVSELVRRIDTAVAPLGLTYEILMVLDGCTDGTLERLLQLRSRVPALRIVELSRNFGLQNAVQACLQLARGDMVVLLDGDLQDPPELIPQLVEKCRRGADVVYTRKTRREEGALARWMFSLFYLLQTLLSTQRIPRQAGNFSCLSRRAVNALLSMPERNRYFPGLRAWIGFPTAEVPYARAARYAGRPKQSFIRLFSLALDGLFYFTDVPLKMTLVLGVLSLLCALGLSVNVLVQKLITHTAILGWTSTIIAISFFAGVQLVCLGILGLYVHRIFDEVRKRPWFFVHREWPAGGADHATQGDDPAPDQRPC